jgi:hypothetical protein
MGHRPSYDPYLTRMKSVAASSVGSIMTVPLDREAVFGRVVSTPRVAQWSLVHEPLLSHAFDAWMPATAKRDFYVSSAAVAASDRPVLPTSATEADPGASEAAQLVAHTLSTLHLFPRNRTMVLNGLAHVLLTQTQCGAGMDESVFDSMFQQCLQCLSEPGVQKNTALESPVSRRNKVASFRQRLCTHCCVWPSDATVKSKVHLVAYTIYCPDCCDGAGDYYCADCDVSKHKGVKPPHVNRSPHTGDRHLHPLALGLGLPNMFGSSTDDQVTASKPDLPVKKKKDDKKDKKVEAEPKAASPSDRFAAAAAAMEASVASPARPSGPPEYVPSSIEHIGQWLLQVARRDGKKVCVYAYREATGM